MLIKSDKVLKHKITLLNVKIDLINKLDLINILSLITIVMTNNEKFSIYQIVN